ncbi:MAG: methyltetrahydrofolate cobalamin methyltransferase [candidate division NC10 bacterium]|nr:methyltetrahydrofolate cobalamin methyltransferase [candidate division NC10 bacterium]
MLIVGERINSSRKPIQPAIESKDAGTIQEIARRQEEAGADYIDVNAGTFVSAEPEYLEWLVKTVQEVVEVPLCIDSPNPEAAERGMQACKKRPILNSISGESKRLEQMLPLVKRHGCSVIALCMDDSGIPESAQGRLHIACGLLEKMEAEGVERSRVWFDPLIYPVSTGSQFGEVALETIRLIKSSLPGAQTICGLSNISHGLPNRKLLNQAFLVMCMAAGLDGVILDPLDRRMMALLLASEALLGRDEFCSRYIAAHRAGRLEE